jgi:branched-chain amino acid aminotransferase
MPEPIAYFNGRIVPASQAVVSVHDQGFMLGATVAEQLRTFGGKLFRLPAHLDRLDRSLAIVGVDSRHSHEDFTRIAAEIVAHNHNLLPDGDDLGLTIFVTPGEAPMADVAAPTVCLHTRLLPFHHFAHKYREGEALATTDIEQVSSHCWPPELKCRSRMHFYLADRQAALRYPGSRALMLDANGFATEATSANVLVYRRNEGLLTPPRGKILPGISLAVLIELAGQLGFTMGQRDLHPNDFAMADEVLLCSTSPCVLPVTRFNGQPVGGGQPGEVHRQLLVRWSDLVNVDIAEQALQYANR